jgi:hypothetical protein
MADSREGVGGGLANFLGVQAAAEARQALQGLA